MSNRKEKIMTKLSELVDLLIEEKELISQDEIETKVEETKVEEPKKEKPAKEEKILKVYSKANPPKGAKEVKAFHENIWSKLTADQQNDYIAGKIDSAGNPLEVTLTKEDVKVALVAFNEKNGDEKTIGLLKSFGATKFSELSPDKYADFVKATETKEEKGNLFD
jgi:hypothetical protein